MTLTSETTGLTQKRIGYALSSQDLQNDARLQRTELQNCRFLKNDSNDLMKFQSAEENMASNYNASDKYSDRPYTLLLFLTSTTVKMWAR